MLDLLQPRRGGYFNTGEHRIIIHRTDCEKINSHACHPHPGTTITAPGEFRSTNDRR